MSNLKAEALLREFHYNGIRIPDPGPDLTVEQVRDLLTLSEVDWGLLNSRNFQHDPDDPGKKERYQAEALIWKHVPLEAFLGICSCNEAVDAYVKAELTKRTLDVQSMVQRNWYF